MHIHKIFITQKEIDEMESELGKNWTEIKCKWNLLERVDPSLTDLFLWWFTDQCKDFYH